MVGYVSLFLQMVVAKAACPSRLGSGKLYCNFSKMLVM